MDTEKSDLSIRLIRKLLCYGPLGDADRALVAEITRNAKQVGAQQTIIQEGDRPENVQVVLSGFAVRHKSTPEGGRQIFAYLIPGDFCDLHVALLASMDHSISTVSDCTIATISRSAVMEIVETRPALARAFWWCSLVDSATLREWVLNVGQRFAEQRVAHLFCELYVRLQAVGLAEEKSFELPLTQLDLADTVGVSHVHINRSLKALREAGLVTFRDQSVAIPDVERLKAYAEFEPGYLHLQKRTA